MTLSKILSAFALGVILIFIISVFILEFESVEEKVVSFSDFGRASLSMRSDYCNYAYGVNYTYRPDFEGTNNYCDATYTLATKSFTGDYLINNTAFQAWIIRPEQKIINQDAVENMLDPVLFGGIFVLMIMSFIGVLFVDKISNLSIFLAIMPGIPIGMISVWIFGKLVRSLLWDVLPKIYPSFSPNFPLFFWQLDNIGMLVLIYLCLYLFCLAVSIENLREQGARLIQKRREI